MMRARPHQSKAFWIVLAVLAVGTLAAWAVVNQGESNPDRLWKKALDDFQAGRYEHTEKSLTRLGRLRQPTALDWMLRAQLAMVRGRPDEALADFARIPDDHPMAARARLKAGQIELRRYRARAAEEAFLAALKLDPKLIQAHRELIYIYGVQLRRPELNAHFRALSELAPMTFDNAFHWCLTRNNVWEPRETAAEMEKFVKADPTDHASRIALAETLRQLGRLDDAESTLKVLPDSDPDKREVRARIALDRGDDRAAEAFLAAGPADHPGLARLRGRFALAHRDGPTAVRNFRAAYEIEPDNRDVLLGLGNALAMVGDSAGAAPYQDAARKLDALGALVLRAAAPASRHDPKLPLQLGAACEAARRIPEARTWYKIAISYDPLDVEAQQALFRLNASANATKGH